MSDDVKKVRKRRASNDDLCVRYKSKRAKLYYQKRKLRKELESGKYRTTKQMESYQKKLVKLESRIFKVDAKIFKCGKKYAKLKQTRKTILNKISRLKNELKRNHELPYKERNKILGEIKELSDRARDLSLAMGMDIVEQRSGELRFELDVEKGESSESVTLWEAKDRVNGLVETKRFDTVFIGEDVFDVGLNKFALFWALDDYIAEIMANQRNSNVKTPMIVVTENMKERVLRVY